MLRRFLSILFWLFGLVWVVVRMVLVGGIPKRKIPSIYLTHAVTPTVEAGAMGVGEYAHVTHLYNYHRMKRKRKQWIISPYLTYDCLVY